MTLAPIILFVFPVVVSTIQEPPPPGGPPPPPGLPIDGVVIFILILGLLYGIKKKREVLNLKKNS